MVAKVEASEVATIEEKYEPGFSSSQSLHKPDSDGILHSDQANYPSCPDLLETEDDDISDDTINDMDVIHKCSTIFPEGKTAVEDHETDAPNENSEEASRDFGEFLSDEKNANLKGTDGEPFTLKDATSEQGNSLESGDGIQVADAILLEDHDGDTQYCSEVANKQPATSDLKSETGTLDSVSVSCGETISDLTVTCETEVLSISDASNGPSTDISLEPAEVNLDGALSSNHESIVEYDDESPRCNNIFMNLTDDSTANEVSLEERSNPDNVLEYDGRNSENNDISMNSTAGSTANEVASEDGNNHDNLLEYDGGNSHSNDVSLDSTEDSTVNEVSLEDSSNHDNMLVYDGGNSYSNNISMESADGSTANEVSLEDGSNADNSLEYDGGNSYSNNISMDSTASSTGNEISLEDCSNHDNKLEYDGVVSQFNNISMNSTAGPTANEVAFADVSNNHDMLECDGGNPKCKTISMVSIDGSTSNTKALAKPFNFLIRIPKFNDENLREQMRIARLNIEEKTKIREAIRIQIQEKRADSQINGCDYKNTKIEHRKAWDLVTLKRMEIDSVQSMINKAKNVLSIQDIDTRIYNMERTIQHETHTLKEEKQLIRGIKQLKQLRVELSSNLGSQDEINQALERREELEERLKVLRKELDILKDAVQKAEAAVVKAAKKIENGFRKIKELETRFRAANDIRQEAYANLQGLRKELRGKNKHFFKYKDDAAAASMYASGRDEEALHCLCMSQVDNFMELWNTNEEFRKEYVKFNTRSTVKRLGTLDGRSLGPNEEPLILPSYAGGTVETTVLEAVQIDELNQETIDENVMKSEVIKFSKKTAANENQKKTSENAPSEPVVGNGSAAISVENATHEVLAKSNEEIELARKAEEQMRMEEEAKLKEQRRLEELAKAHEARERKKRQAEKEQLRAQLKAQKEAELREKEREKKQRKKEKQKAAAPDVNDTNAHAENAVELGQDKEVKDMTTSSEMANKKPNKSWNFAKQSKTKTLPPALRNRNKKYYRQWLLVGVSCLAILVIFWLGNLGAFSKTNIKRRDPRGPFP